MSDSSRVESIVFAALKKKTAAERALYLEQACGGDDQRPGEHEAEAIAHMVRFLHFYPSRKSSTGISSRGARDIDGNGEGLTRGQAPLPFSWFRTGVVPRRSTQCRLVSSSENSTLPL